MRDIAEGKTAADVKTGKRGRAIVRGGKGTAARTVGLLGGIFSYAVEASWLKENPVRGVKRYRDRRNERFLNADELSRLGEALAQAEAAGENPHALAIIRLLILTGARKSEIEQLKWSEIDRQFQFLRLGDSKTGQKLVVLNAVALDVLDGVSCHASSDFVFSSLKGAGWYQSTPKVWKRIRSAARLEGVRLHDLRHSYASFALAEGAGLATIGKLLGHSDYGTTERYAHLSDVVVRRAAERTSSSMKQLLSGGKDA